MFNVQYNDLSQLELLLWHWLHLNVSYLYIVTKHLRISNVLITSQEQHYLITNVSSLIKLPTTLDIVAWMPVWYWSHLCTVQWKLCVVVIVTVLFQWEMINFLLRHRHAPSNRWKYLQCLCTLGRSAYNIGPSWCVLLAGGWLIGIAQLFVHELLMLTFWDAMIPLEFITQFYDWESF